MIDSTAPWHCWSNIRFPSLMLESPSDAQTSWLLIVSQNRHVQSTNLRDIPLYSILFHDITSIYQHCCWIFHRFHRFKLDQSPAEFLREGQNFGGFHVGSLALQDLSRPAMEWWCWCKPVGDGGAYFLNLTKIFFCVIYNHLHVVPLFGFRKFSFSDDINCNIKGFNQENCGLLCQGEMKEPTQRIGTIFEIQVDVDMADNK